MPFGSWPVLVIQASGGMMAPREQKEPISKSLVKQRRNERPCCHRLAHYLAFTTSIMQRSSAPHGMKWTRPHPRLWSRQLGGGGWEEDVVTW